MVVTRKTLNETYAAIMAESGSVFVSDLGRKEAWRINQRLTELLKVSTKYFQAVHRADGMEYSGYEFKLAGMLRCPRCGTVIFDFSG